MSRHGKGTGGSHLTSNSPAALLAFDGPGFVALGGADLQGLWTAGDLDPAVVGACCVEHVSLLLESRRNTDEVLGDGGASRRVVRTTTSSARAAKHGNSAAACSSASQKFPVSTSTSTR